MVEAGGPAAAFRFGGHQSFALRIAWLPKAVAAIQEGIDPLTDPVTGIVELGLGKNMVEALRCWIDAYGVARRSKGGGWELTPEGDAIFGKGRLDPYLEDSQTLWWLHWTISTATLPRFFAWELLVNRWTEDEFSASEVVAHFLREAEGAARALSPVSARQHFDVWLQTYLSGDRSVRGEDGLDSPLAALRLVRVAGERHAAGGKRETVYGFDRLPRATLGDAMLRYAMTAWWQASNADEETTSLRELTYGRGSPGRVFRIGEGEMRDRLAAMSRIPDSGFELRESINQIVVTRTRVLDRLELLREAYQGAPALEFAHA